MRTKSIIMVLIILSGLALMPATGWTQLVTQQDADERRATLVMEDISGEREQAVLNYIKELSAEKYDRLNRVKLSRPDFYNKLIVNYYRELQMFEKVKTNDPERYRQLKEVKEMEEETQILAKEYRQAKTEKAKADIKAKLKKLLFKSFDLRHINRQKEIERLEKKLLKLKNNNKARLENKDKMVERRLNRLIGEQELKW